MTVTLGRRLMIAGLAAACLGAVYLGPACSWARAEETKPITLFNGRDLEGWTAVLEDNKAKAADVWSVADGVLMCKGNPRGYLRTVKEDFHDYVLTLEWRFPAGSKGGNSGVLLHTTTPGALGIWPKSMEAQLNHQNAGDIWVIGTTCEIENADKRVMGRRHLNLTDDSEKPIGEWNAYEITCKGDEITIKVNGDLVNHVTKCSVQKGAISLQSEGAEIHFRNIKLTPLK
jgi:3-keto-disaccharide hydrolase